MKKIIINLKRRPDRKDYFYKHNINIDSDHEWFTAIDGDELDMDTVKLLGYDYDKKWENPFNYKKLRKGEFGCAISHIKVWEKCILENKPILILEDDVIFLDNYDEDSYEKLLKKYNFIYLGYNENEPEKIKNINDTLIRPSYPYNLHSYIITPEAARVLLTSEIKKNIIPIDDYVCTRLNDLKVAALRVDATKQASRDKLGTDIEDENYMVEPKKELGVVHVVTVGTEDFKMKKLNQSVKYFRIHNQAPFENLGKNKKWKGTDMSGPGGGMKINLLREYIENLPPNDVVLFVDGYDVFFGTELKEIVQRYLGFNTRVLFAAEENCWPDSNMVDKFPPAEYNSKYRFLNSGLFIGEVRELKKILKNPIKNSEDDQLYYQKAFLSGEYDIKLDYEAYIFQCHEPHLQVRGDQLYNPITRCFNCIYHGNGGEEAKIIFEKIYKEFFDTINKTKPPAPNVVGGIGELQYS